MSKLLNWKNEIKCTQVHSNNYIVANIASTGSGKPDQAEKVSEEFHDIELLKKQLKVTALLKRICVAREVDNSALMSG